MNKSARFYVDSGMSSVTGWLSKESATLIGELDELQGAARISGATAEIGVHHGRLFVLLALLRRRGEAALAIDLFDQQQLNVDHSGRGDVDILVRNLKRFGVENGTIDFLKSSSMDVKVTDILNRVGPVRLFSVDGGHTAEIAGNDLRLSQGTLAPGGVVIVDDVFTSIFPGVSVAMGEYLRSRKGLIPFAISIEKTFLTDRESATYYRDELIERMADIYLRNETYYGHEIAIFRDFPPWNERLQIGFAKSSAYRRISESPAVKSCRPIVLRVLGR